MSETSATAMLVGTRDMFAARSNVLTATVPRGDIEDALALDPPAELILDIVRRPEGKDDLERRTVNVVWARKDLESLLDYPDAEAITFSFDPAELEQAIEDSEVEGHGLREAAVVLSIAAAAAASGASGAFGAVHEEASLAERGIGVPSAAAVHTEASLAERGIGVQAAAAVHDETTLAARGIDPGTLPAVHDETTLAARGIDSGTLPAVHDETTLAARGIDPGTTPAVHDETTLAARGIEPATIPVVDTGSGSGFEVTVDSETIAGIAGGLAGAGLLIAAAAFAVRRREPGTA